MIDVIVAFSTHAVPCLVVSNVAVTNGLVHRVLVTVLLSHSMLDWLLHIV